MTPAIDITQMGLSDVAILHKVCGDLYSQNFHNHWDEGGLEKYIDKVFGVEILNTELSGNNIQYYIALADQRPVGFMKLNLFSNLPGMDMKKGMELEKMYILPARKRMKIGTRLLDVAFDVAKSNHTEIFWLSVIDRNPEAISFYEKAGFKFHSKIRVDYPKFREELKGMWRMYLEVPRVKAPV